MPSSRQYTLCPDLKVRKYSAMEKDLALPVLYLPILTEGLLGGCQPSFASRVDVTFTLNKLEGMEVSLNSLVEIISWADWWMVTVQCLANSTHFGDMAKVYHLFCAVGKALVNMANVASVNLTNCVQK